MYNDDNLEVTVGEVEAMLNAPDAPAVLIDVREHWELERGVLPGAAHMPLSEFERFLPELSVDADYVIYCEHGIRSLDVTAWLRANSRVRASSMAGGFAVWRGPVEKFPGREE